jgi:hypothetical protein
MRGLRLAKGSWNTICARRAHLAQGGGRQAEDGLTFDAHLAFGGFDQPQHRARQRGLAAT